MALSASVMRWLTRVYLRPRRTWISSYLKPGDPKGLDLAATLWHRRRRVERRPQLSSDRQDVTRVGRLPTQVLPIADLEADVASLGGIEAPRLPSEPTVVLAEELGLVAEVARS
jgi:hypothetical protein